MLHCILEDSTVVWKMNIVHDKCPFHVVDMTRLGAYENFMIGFSKNYFFQLIGNEYICGFNMWKTEEGLHLVEWSSKVEEYVKSNMNDPKGQYTSQIDMKLIEKDMTLADTDANNWKNLNLLRRVQLQTCSLFNGLLESFKNQNNKFFRVFNGLGQEFIIFSKEGTIYVPTCVNIKEIYVIK